MKKVLSKLLIILYLLLAIVVLFFTCYKMYINLNDIVITDIKIVKYDEENNKLTIEIYKKDNKHNQEFTCNAENKNETISNGGENNKCTLILDLNQNYTIYLKHKLNTSKTYKISDFGQSILSFNFTQKEFYLLVGDEEEITYSDKLLNNSVQDYKFESTNKDVAIVENNKIKAIGLGTCEIYSSLIDDTIKVTVTDLITAPYVPKNKKTIIPCNNYTEEEANTLDKILAYKINRAGYKTRAAAVAAARFLSLEFKYRIPYFYENGRIHSSGVHYVDGEGRYYHEGLYLYKSKMETITNNWRGPSIWGCPLTNLEDKPEYGYYPGASKPNGLDCSGFVSWALKNAGFDPGDIGAGETPYPHQMTDLGEFTKITPELINSDKVKTGDLINWWGHIAMIIGIDDNNYYVAESLPYLGGVVPKVYSKKNLLKPFSYIVLMDKYYQKDGNYSKMF